MIAEAIAEFAAASERVFETDRAQTVGAARSGNADAR